MNDDKYIAWIDEAVRLLRQRIATTSLGDGSVQKLDEITIRSLLANRAGLEMNKFRSIRHEELSPIAQGYNACLDELQKKITDQLGEVMGE